MGLHSLESDKMEKDKEVKTIRCAIYTRKSTSEGLEQDFTSLDAQRESAESYIQSQKHAGWKTLPFQYNDGGFTGATMERPGLQRLLQDIQDHKVDCVVVYKVDRLSRSLLDFVKMLQFFEDHQITFVSVTQHFNTNTSMGRLTLNILLSFAQFEREMISERTKDKMGAARRKGRWVGGKPPLGYDVDYKNRKLVINSREADLIRHIFDLYLEKKALLEVARILNEEGHKTKEHNRSGKKFGGSSFSNGNIQLILNNHTYTGKVKYEDKIYPGEHTAIISEEIFSQVQELLKKNRRERNVSKNRKFEGLLSRLFRCTCCEASMCHGYARKGQHKYRYYICLNAIKRGRKFCPTKSISAVPIENKCLELIRNLLRDERLNPGCWERLNTEQQIAVMRELVEQIAYNGEKGKLIIVLKSSPAKHEFDLPIYELKSHMQKTTEMDFNREPPIRRQLLLAHQTQQMIDQGKTKDLKQVAEWSHINWSRLYQIMNLLYLAPQIQEDIVFRNFEKLQKTSERNIRHISNELDWQKQLTLWQIYLPT